MLDKLLWRLADRGCKRLQGGVVIPHGCLKWGVTQVIIQVLGEDQWVFPMLWGTPIFGNLHIQTQAEGILPPALLLDGASQLRSARLTQRNWGADQGPA